ncbi:hypothetical protein [Streptomyces sp. NRRL F-4474]|uniref:hypothetical protein n=1 Tax=Streptomyces sp. NRRL F-4474 TaxID=1463851 RepID=UPI00131BCD41|nr:hypothetical protein [Streptomyces sp. NRRL F-4474]
MRGGPAEGFGDQADVRGDGSPGLQDRVVDVQLVCVPSQAALPTTAQHHGSGRR